MNNTFDIIDFHTHPFADNKNNICSHTEFCDMSVDNTKNMFSSLGVKKICGSVINKIRVPQGEKAEWKRIKKNNDETLRLRDYYGGFYLPGFHIHPNFFDESVSEMERMKRENVNLIGELVPYFDGWSDYSSDSFSLLLDEAGKRNFIVSFHSQGEDEMDRMVKAHKDVVFVAAHPGEYNSFMRHLERMKYSENYYLDLSGYGIFRYGMLRRAIDVMGEDRILFGSDFPTCNPGMYLGGVLLDSLIKEGEKEKILSLNAKRLLCLK